MPIGVIGLAISAASTVAQVSQANRASRARRNANAISTANETLRNRTARRRKIKELRIREAQIRSASSSSGVAGSSGERGAIGSLNTGAAVSLADQQQNILAIQGINRQNQRVADAQDRIDAIGSFNSLLQEGLKLFEDS